MPAFGVDQISINNTRSVSHDTDYVVVGFSINKIPSLPIVQKIGNLDNGHHKVNNLFLPKFETFNEEDEFVFGYMVINHGGGSSGNVEKACQNALLDYSFLAFDPSQAEVVTYENGSKGPLCLQRETLFADDLEASWNQINGAFQGVSSDRCDGPVAIAKFSFFGSSLADVMLQSEINMTHEGINSHDGCGSNSEYGVSWRLDRA